MTGLIPLRRVVATGAVLLATSTALVAGFVVSQARSGEQPTYRLTAAGLDSGLSCDRLLQWYVDHGIHRVTAWGWQVPVYRQIPLAASGPVPAAPSARGAELDTQTGSSTGTNVQEADVDEPDLAKASDHLLVRIEGEVLETYDVSGSEPERLGAAPLSRIGDPQLLLAGDRAVVIGRDLEDPTAGAPLLGAPSRTRVLTYDLGDPSHPALDDSRVYDGSLTTARQVGSVVRLVLDAQLPTFDFIHPSSTVTQDQALEHNRQVVRDSTIADWLPRVTTYDGGRESSAPLLDCGDVAVPEAFGGLGTMAVVGFDPTEPTRADASAVATESDTAYMSPTHLYVATTPMPAWRGWGPLVGTDVERPTRIYGFDLAGTSATYVGMGSVRGTVAGSWSMDEHDGVLRVAATTAVLSPSTSVVMLRPEAGRLVDVGHLDGLGAGQQLKSVRWFDDIAVLVTFRQMDPFYVVDVSDPTAPRVLGALHLPGWSSYLHPVGPHLVLGLGQESPEQTIEPSTPMPTMPPPPGPVVQPQSTGGAVATTGPVPRDPTPPRGGLFIPLQRAKATLFDISDLTHPRDLDTVAYPEGSVAMAGFEPHQATWLPGISTLLTVIGSGLPETTYDGSRAWLSILTVHDGTLDNRMLPLSAGVRVNDVRTVPLGDGRVVLVAGDSVRFVAV